jgi:hypothetical protein
MFAPSIFRGLNPCCDPCGGRGSKLRTTVAAIGMDNLRRLEERIRGDAQRASQFDCGLVVNAKGGMIEESKRSPKCKTPCEANMMLNGNPSETILCKWPSELQIIQDCQHTGRGQRRVGSRLGSHICAINARHADPENG